jgi:hypothetical protein
LSWINLNKNNGRPIENFHKQLEHLPEGYSGKLHEAQGSWYLFSKVPQGFCQPPGIKGA